MYPRHLLFWLLLCICCCSRHPLQGNTSDNLSKAQLSCPGDKTSLNTGFGWIPILSRLRNHLNLAKSLRSFLILKFCDYTIPRIVAISNELEEREFSFPMMFPNWLLRPFQEKKTFPKCFSWIVRMHLNLASPQSFQAVCATSIHVPHPSPRHLAMSGDIFQVSKLGGGRGLLHLPLEVQGCY